MSGPVLQQKPKSTVTNPQPQGGSYDPLQGNVLGDPLLDGSGPSTSTPAAQVRGDWAQAWNTALDKKPEDDPKKEAPTDPRREFSATDGEATFRSGGGAAGGGTTTTLSTEKFATKNADGSGFTLGEKGVTGTLGGSQDGKPATTTVALGSDGIGYTRRTAHDDAIIGTNAVERSVGLGEKGLTFGYKESNSADPDGKNAISGNLGINTNGVSASGRLGKAGVDLQLGKTSQVGITNSNGTGGSLGYDSEKGEVIVGGTYGDWKGQVNIGKTGGTVALGNKQYGGSATLKLDEHTVDVGASGYFAGFGAGAGYHSVTDKESIDRGSNTMLGQDAVGMTNLNETGWNADVGIKVVNGGVFSNDASTTSFATTHFNPNDPASVQRAQALREQSKRGKDGMDFDKLQKGESVAFGEADGGGFNAGVNALGIARYGYSRNSTDIDNGSIARRDNGELVASHTTGDAVQSAHDYGALWGVYGGKTAFTSGTENTVGVSSSDEAHKAALLQYAKDGKDIDASAVRAGDEVVDGVKVDHTRKATQAGYSNDQSFVFGVGSYNHTSNDVQVKEERLIDGGGGALTTSTQIADRSTGGQVLGVGHTSSSSDVTTSSSAFAGANKDGQTKEQNAADFKRLQSMADKGASGVELSKMKSGETIALDKAASTTATGKTTTVAKAASSTSTTQKASSGGQEVTRLGSGATLRQSGNKEVTSKAEEDILWGLSSSTNTQTSRLSGTVQVTGGGGELQTLQRMVKAGVVTQGAYDKVTAKDAEINALTKEIAALEGGGQSYAAKLGKDKLAKLQVQRQELVDWCAIEASRTLKPGQKVDGVTVQGTATSFESSAASASGSWWGLGATKGGTDKLKMTAEDKLVQGGTQSRRTVTTSHKAELNDHWAAKSATASATSGPNGSSLMFSAAVNSSADTKGTKFKVDLPAADVTAIAKKYNADGDPLGFWARAGGEAAKATVDPALKSAFQKVRTPAEFARLSAAQQKAFVSGLLADPADGNPFEALAAIELMGISEAKADLYLAMFQRTAAADADGDASRVGEEFIRFLTGIAKTDKDLALKLKDRITVGTL